MGLAVLLRPSLRVAAWKSGDSPTLTVVAEDPEGKCLRAGPPFVSISTAPLVEGVIELRADVQLQG
ncbi:MAG: hypothetical protein WCP28_04360 [Actinomycetes bacterium]